MIFENYPIGQQVEETGHYGTELNITNFHMQEHSHYDLNVVVIPGKQLAVHFGFNENEYEKSEVERLRGHFEKLMQQVLRQPSVKIEDLELLSQQEKEYLLSRFQSNDMHYPRKKRFMSCSRNRRIVLRTIQRLYSRVNNSPTKN